MNGKLINGEDFKYEFIGMLLLQTANALLSLPLWGRWRDEGATDEESTTFIN